VVAREVGEFVFEFELVGVELRTVFLPGAVLILDERKVAAVVEVALLAVLGALLHEQLDGPILLLDELAFLAKSLSEPLLFSLLAGFQLLPEEVQLALEALDDALQL
jgi:hypothetical protein